MKVCSKCKVEKELKYFNTRKGTKSTHRSLCKTCEKDTRFKRDYNITHEDYLNLLEKQNYKCVCCGINNKDAGVKGLVVDHNHTTGAVRELLCSQCNTALGLLKENEEVVSNMLEYIRKHNG